MKKLTITFNYNETLTIYKVLHYASKPLLICSTETNIVMGVLLFKLSQKLAKRLLYHQVDYRVSFEVEELLAMQWAWRNIGLGQGNSYSQNVMQHLVIAANKHVENFKTTQQAIG